MMSKCHLTKYPLHVNSCELNGGYRSVEVLDFSAEFEYKGICRFCKQRAKDLF